MSEVKESTAWRGEYTGSLANGSTYSSSSAGKAAEIGDWKFQVAEFAKGAAEMSVEFGKGVRDVVKQTLLREDSVIMRKLKGPCLKIWGKLGFLNEYLPEDRDPVHAWTLISCVLIITLAGDYRLSLFIVLEIDCGNIIVMNVRPCFLTVLEMICIKNACIDDISSLFSRDRCI